MFTVGIVPYLNAVPLVAELEGDDVRILRAVPAGLIPGLQEGRYDAALVPVAAVARGVGDGFLGAYGIAGEGPVESVLAFLRRPLAAVRSVRLDPASRTSAALLRHLLARAGARPTEVAWAPAPGPDPSATEGDAVLVIGDPALEARRRWEGEVLDLGRAWTEATGLPFVFARWTARRGLTPGQRAGLARALDRAAERGLARREEHARAFAAARGGDEAAAVLYVQRAIRYRIGPREEEGLARFLAIVRAQDPVPGGEELTRA